MRFVAPPRKPWLTPGAGRPRGRRNSRQGLARPGATLRDGALLERAHRDNDSNYPEVAAQGLGRLCCLSVEVYGRWGADPLDIVPAMARARAEGLPLLDWLGNRRADEAASRALKPRAVSDAVARARSETLRALETAQAVIASINAVIVLKPCSP